MLDTEGQLARLRQRIASIDRKYAQPAKPAAPAPTPRKWVDSYIDEWSQGSVVDNEHGAHFQTERLYPRHRQHGSADIGALADLPDDLLDALGEGEIPACSPERWAFLDTETTGLAGGSGTYAFLIGVGRITPEGFSIRQFFLREYAEEKSVLTALSEHLESFDVLITYNGRTFDQPLLETRYRMNRLKLPFGRLPHLDFLYGARRLWKLRLESCRLMQLEQQILGFEREGDLPGELIPFVYFEYLRSREAQRIVPILHHNAIDILTLGCLSGIVPAAFRSTDSESLHSIGVRRGEELLGIARWLLAAEQYEQALELMKRATQQRLTDKLLFRTLWDIALLEKKLQRPNAALTIFTELAGCENEYRVVALEELAKYYEHEERNYVLAMEFTQQAFHYDPDAALAASQDSVGAPIARPDGKAQADLISVQ